MLRIALLQVVLNATNATIRFKAMNATVTVTGCPSLCSAPYLLDGYRFFTAEEVEEMSAGVASGAQHCVQLINAAEVVCVDVQSEFDGHRCRGEPEYLHFEVGHNLRRRFPPNQAGHSQHTCMLCHVGSSWQIASRCTC